MTHRGSDAKNMDLNVTMWTLHRIKPMFSLLFFFSRFPHFLCSLFFFSKPTTFKVAIRLPNVWFSEFVSLQTNTCGSLCICVRWEKNKTPTDFATCWSCFECLNREPTSESASVCLLIWYSYRVFFRGSGTSRTLSFSSIEQNFDQCTGTAHVKIGRLMTDEMQKQPCRVRAGLHTQLESI